MVPTSSRLMLALLMVGCVEPKAPASGDSASPADSDTGSGSNTDSDTGSGANTDSDSASPVDSDSAPSTDSDSASPADTDTAPPVDADGDGHLSDVDCDDGDPATNPDATETCDEIDNDCDGDVDERGATGASTWYRDFDVDGYGSSTVSTEACTAPDHYVATGGDCDDGDGSIWPGAIEVCDDQDNDCDGATDEDDAVDAVTCYTDGDTDGYGDAAYSSACDCPSGTSAEDGDCDDANADVHPGVGENAVDGIDNDCDGSTDEVGLCPNWAGMDGTTSWTYAYSYSGTETFSVSGLSGTREVEATLDASTETVALSSETTSGGRCWSGSSVKRTETAEATYTCDDDGLALASFSLSLTESEYCSYAGFSAEQSCTFDPPVLILPSDLEAGDTWTTSGVSVDCTFDLWATAATTATDTLDFTFAADASTSATTWGDALTITGDPFTMAGSDLTLDFMADGAWVRGVGRTEADAVTLTGYSTR